jgi:hypothetical protein
MRGLEHEPVPRRPSMHIAFIAGPKQLHMQPQPSGASTATRGGDDLRWLSRITWSAVVNLVGVVLDTVSAVVILTSLSAAGIGMFPGASFGPSGPSASQIQGMVQTLRYMTTLLPLTLLFLLGGMVLLWTGFRGLSRGGAGEFSLPSKLTLVAVVGLAVLIPGMLVFYSTIGAVMASLGQQGAARASGALGSLAAGGVLLLIGAVLVLIGYIGGMILGLWRVGGSYGQTVLKVAAILTIIPFLGLIAPILVLIGVNSAKVKARPAQPAAQPSP